MSRCQVGSPLARRLFIHIAVFVEEIFAVAFLLKGGLVMRPDLALFANDNFGCLFLEVVMCRALSADRLAGFGLSGGNPTILLIS